MELELLYLDSYSDLQRIFNADDPKKEAEYQLKLISAKLEVLGVSISDLKKQLVS